MAHTDLKNKKKVDSKLQRRAGERNVYGETSGNAILNRIEGDRR